ncbi:hypothetical protein SAMN05421869_11122 [Nonomuraea jiangxiensis]|uniref:Uncharacterized protein n=1 Tax=Nonomuraea jiangxiensis TaxID=633440 RepID=A0A1G8UL38_9ACTN|nr:hypothetical protein SAMN05421869_11122 [Nonomuraea jiangxiensis]
MRNLSSKRPPAGNRPGGWGGHVHARTGDHGLDAPDQEWNALFGVNVPTHV